MILNTSEVIEKYCCEDNIYRYGGCSIIYHSKSDKRCYKLLRAHISADNRNEIFRNIIKLKNQKNINRDPHFILPDDFGFIDDQLVIQELPFLPYLNAWQFKYVFYMQKRYLLFIKHFILKIKDYSKLGIIITDLKPSNILVSENNLANFIDNDYSVFSDSSLCFSDFGNIFNRNYRYLFSKSLDSNFNYYSLLWQLCLLLIESETLSKIWPNNSLTDDVLNQINMYIQQNRIFPQIFKQEMKNIINPKREIQINSKFITEIMDFCDKQNNGKTINSSQIY